MTCDQNGSMWDFIRGTNHEFDYFPSYSSPCSGGSHVFLYTSVTTKGEIPEGMSCSCGLYAAFYENCPTCGHRCLKLKNR